MKANRTLTLQRKFRIDNMVVYLQYGEKEIEYLKKTDKKLAAVIDQAGMIERKLPKIQMTL